MRPAVNGIFARRFINRRLRGLLVKNNIAFFSAFFTLTSASGAGCGFFFERSSDDALAVTGVLFGMGMIMDTSRKVYQTPVLEDLGTAKDLTKVGQTQPGDDTLPGQARGKDGGSINPGGLS
jgi:hypothetical protein